MALRPAGGKCGGVGHRAKIHLLTASGGRKQCTAWRTSSNSSSSCWRNSRSTRRSWRLAFNLPNHRPQTAYEQCLRLTRPHTHTERAREREPLAGGVILIDCNSLKLQSWFASGRRLVLPASCTKFMCHSSCCRCRYHCCCCCWSACWRSLALGFMSVRFFPILFYIVCYLAGVFLPGNWAVFCPAPMPIPQGLVTLNCMQGALLPS